VPAALVPLAAFFATNYAAVGRWSPAYAEFGGPWYEFEGSVWAIQRGEMKHGIDWAYQTESPLGYAFHLFVGHHGIFSLSPIYLLTLGGAWAGILGAFKSMTEQTHTEPARSQWRSPSTFNVAAALALVTSAIVVGFYIFGVNERNRNYGGWTNGLRWLMWLTPLWLTAMLPAVDWLSGRRWGRGMAYALLAVSIFSASYLPSNPWRHPWLYDLMESGGWIRY